MRMAVNKWIPFNWSCGTTMRRGRRVSQIVSRLSLVGFPSRGLEGVVSLFEEVGDCAGVHFGRLLQGITHKLGEYAT
jgi:hypothetical protein